MERPSRGGLARFQFFSHSWFETEPILYTMPSAILVWKSIFFNSPAPESVRFGLVTSASESTARSRSGAPDFGFGQQPVPLLRTSALDPPDSLSNDARVHVQEAGVLVRVQAQGRRVRDVGQPVVLNMGQLLRPSVNRTSPPVLELNEPRKTDSRYIYSTVPRSSSESSVLSNLLHAHPNLSVFRNSTRANKTHPSSPSASPTPSHLHSQTEKQRSTPQSSSVKGLFLQRNHSMESLGVKARGGGAAERDDEDDTFFTPSAGDSKENERGMDRSPSDTPDKHRAVRGAFFTPLFSLRALQSCPDAALTSHQATARPTLHLLSLPPGHLPTFLLSQRPRPPRRTLSAPSDAWRLFLPARPPARRASCATQGEGRQRLEQAAAFGSSRA